MTSSQLMNCPASDSPQAPIATRGALRRGMTPRFHRRRLYAFDHVRCAPLQACLPALPCYFILILIIPYSTIVTLCHPLRLTNDPFCQTPPLAAPLFRKSVVMRTAVPVSTCRHSAINNDVFLKAWLHTRGQFLELIDVIKIRLFIYPLGVPPPA